MQHAVNATGRHGALYLRSLGSGPPRDILAMATGLLAELDAVVQRRSSGPPSPRVDDDAPDSGPPGPLDDSDPIGDRLAMAASAHHDRA